MSVQMQSVPSFASIISAVSILFYCTGFFRVQLELNDQNRRISALESVAASSKPLSNDQNMKLIKDAVEIQSYEVHRNRRQADSARNATEAKSKADTIHEFNKLLSEWRSHLCQSKGVTCSSGLPGPPGPPGPRGNKGAQGRRGRTGNNGDKGIMGSPGKSGKQGIMGPPGLKGEPGTKGEKGDVGSAGMPGTKGEPGESISSPTVLVSPVTLTVNEGGSASFKCSVSGNPEPAVVWSKLGSQSEIVQSAVAKGELQLRKVTGNDSGVYQCSAANILGKAQSVAQLLVNVLPRVYLHPGPLYVAEGSDAVLPTCHVTGHPQPVVTWSKSFGQLPQGRLQFTNSAMKLLDTRKVDSDNYLCTARNQLGSVVRKTLLVVVPLPLFNVKPPVKVFAGPGDTLTLNCGATGDPEPVISWKREGAQLPAGRTQQTNGALVIRDTRIDDSGKYICVATSAGVSDVQSVTYIEVKKPQDCSDLLKSGHTQSGEYFVNPDGRGKFKVYCDMSTDGGSWTVFHRRQDGSVDFYRGWNDYKAGFGQVSGEFWLGNDKIHRLTASRPSSLRVELEDWNGVRVYAKYDKFNIGDEQAQYQLEVGSYSGTAKDSLQYHNNMAFTTKDRDNDRSSINCAILNSGAWWYKHGQHSNLNGRYLGEKSNTRGVRWFHFRRDLSLKFAEMKIRPLS